MMIPTPNTKELRIAISITMVDINYVREYWASTRFKAHLRVDFSRKPHGEDLFLCPRKRGETSDEKQAAVDILTVSYE